MEELTGKISSFPIMGFILGIFIIYLGLRFVRLVLVKLIHNSRLVSSINRNFSIFELLVWLLYMLLMTPRFYEYSKISGVILSLLLVISILLIGWYAGRDFISGFIVRANTGFKKNARIKTDSIEGIIIQFYPRNFKLLNDNGEKTLIPYSNILGRNIQIRNSEKSRISKHIKLSISSDKSYESISKEIRYMIMMHPKALTNIAPSINIISQENNNMLLDIKVSAKDNKGLAEIESYLKMEF